MSRNGDANPTGAAIRRPYAVDIRRVSELEPDAPLPDSHPDLVARIADEIRASGRMSFARFMELALYDPTAGYYAAAGPTGTGTERGPGRGGDFLTAPEGHPIFGWAVARHLESVWGALDRPSTFVVREHGEVGRGDRGDQRDVHGLACLVGREVLPQRGLAQAADAPEEIELVAAHRHADRVGVDQLAIRGFFWFPRDYSDIILGGTNLCRRSRVRRMTGRVHG